MDLQDPKSASVSAQTECVITTASLPKVSSPLARGGSPPASVSAQDRMYGLVRKKGYGLPRQLCFSLLKFVPRDDTRVCSAAEGNASVSCRDTL